MDVAAFDLGSNSFHSLIARVNGGVITKLGSQKHTLRLGAHVQSCRMIPSGPFDQALSAVRSLVAHARAFPGVRLVAVGTSALREAENGADFARAVFAEMGVRVDIVSGSTEARLVYAGARSCLPRLPRRVGVVDIGGGSVEIAVGTDGACTPVTTLPLGCLRVGRSRGLGGSLDLARGIELVMRHGAVLAEARRLAPETWVFSGGTARAFGDVARRTARVEPKRGMSVHCVREVAGFLASADPDVLMAHDVDAARVETLGGGAAILAALTVALDARSIVVSPGGLREGIALREAGAFGADTQSARSSETEHQGPAAVHTAQR